ncbi:MAG TPA: hypothetical protein PLQ11_01025 [Beijerinckiaceae bacterium]|nr:hypothetical protein [Beijerinckiaceae bacterium]
MPAPPEIAAKLEHFPAGLNHCDDQFRVKDKKNATSVSFDPVGAFFAGFGPKMIIPPGFRAAGARFGRWLGRIDGYTLRQPPPGSPRGPPNAMGSIWSESALAQGCLAIQKIALKMILSLMT